MKTKSESLKVREGTLEVLRTSKVTRRYYHMNTYHQLYNRGVNRGKIFWDEKDYSYFHRKMKEYKEKYLISILYCLLPNHFHLFVKQKSNEYEIGKFTGDLTNAYTKGTNKRYSRSGVLFEGRTKSKLIINENYFLQICKYILNNPVTSNLVNMPEQMELLFCKRLSKSG